jgi:hypothetical protein
MKYYLNFKEDTGEVWKSTNEIDESTPYIEIDRETLIDFNSGEKQHSDYIVVPSSKEGETYELKFIHKDIDMYDVEKSIHQIETNREPKINSVIIKQDIVNGLWSIALTPQLQTVLSSTSYYKGRNHDLYVTYKDDPNILLDTLKIDFTQVLEKGEYTVDYANLDVAKMDKVSVYCAKIFDDYVHLTETQ